MILIYILWKQTVGVEEDEMVDGRETEGAGDGDGQEKVRPHRLPPATAGVSVPQS